MDDDAKGMDTEDEDREKTQGILATMDQPSGKATTFVNLFVDMIRTFCRTKWRRKVPPRRRTNLQPPWTTTKKTN